MPLPANVDAIANALRQTGIKLDKLTSRTTGGVQPFSVFDILGNPGQGVLPGVNTANGVVPTDAVAGYPSIHAFSGSNDGFLARVAYKWSVAGHLALYDRLFVAGNYSYTASAFSDVTLASQPSFSGRVPVVGGNPDYTGLELWVENVAASTGNLDVRVNYLDDVGVASDTTAVGVGAVAAIGRCWQLPFETGQPGQSGRGISRIDRVRAGTASVGNFNVMILRKLWENRVPVAGGGGVDDWQTTMLPQVWASSALYLLATPDNASTSQPSLSFDIINC